MAVDEKWYFTKEQLLQSPSRKSGYDEDKELSCRQQAANFIQDMGQRLQVSQLCINTAIVYMHRFYVFHSLAAFHRNAIAAAALFLAAKVEEQPRKLEHVIKVAHLCLHRENPNLDTKSEMYLEQAQDLVFNENVLLQTLGFDVAIDHPHTHVVRCCHLVRASKDLAQTSYFMASNSLHLTTMCLQYKPTVVACFCIHLACKWSNWEIPRSNEGKDWFWYIDKTVTIDLLEQLTGEFLAILDKCSTKIKRKMMSMNQNNPPGIPQQPISHDGLQFEEPRKLTGPEAIKAPEGLFPIQKSSSSEKSGASTSSNVAPPHTHHQKIDYREYREKKERERMEREKQQQRDGHSNVSSGSHHHHHHSKSNLMMGKSHSNVQSRSSSGVSHKNYQQPPHGMHFQNIKENRDSSSQNFQSSSSSKDSNYLKQHPPHMERDGNKESGNFHGQYSQSLQHQGYPHKSDANYSGSYSHREGTRGNHALQGSGNSNLAQSHHGQNQNALTNSTNSNNIHKESESQLQAKDSVSSNIRDIINQSVAQKDVHSMTNERKEHIREKSRINYMHGNTSSSNFRPDSGKPGREQIGVNFHDSSDRKIDDYSGKLKDKGFKKTEEELSLEPIKIESTFKESDEGDESSTWNLGINLSHVKTEKNNLTIKSEPGADTNSDSINKSQSGHPMKMYDPKYKGHHYHSSNKISETPSIKIEKTDGQSTSDVHKRQIGDKFHEKHRKLQEHNRMAHALEGSGTLNDMSKHHKFNKEVGDKHKMLGVSHHGDHRMKEKLSPSKYQKMKTASRSSSINYLKSDSGHFNLDPNSNSNANESDRIDGGNQALTAHKPIGGEDSSKNSGSTGGFAKQKNHEFGTTGNLSSLLSDTDSVKSSKTSSIFSPDSKIPPQNILSSLEKDSKKNTNSSSHRNHSSNRTSPNQTPVNSKKTVSTAALPTITTSTTSTTGSLFSPPFPKNIPSILPRHRTSSSSGSETELIPVSNKLEETSGYENIVREKKISLSPTRSPSSSAEKEKKLLVASEKIESTSASLFDFDHKPIIKDSKLNDFKSNSVKSDTLIHPVTAKVNVKLSNEIRSDLGAVIYPTNPKPVAVSKSNSADSKLSLVNSVSTVNLLGIEKMVDTSILPGKPANQFGATVKPNVVSNSNYPLNAFGSSAITPSTDLSDKMVPDQNLLKTNSVSNQEIIDVESLSHSERKRSEKKKKKEKHKHKEKDKDRSERKKEKKKHKEKDKERVKDKEKYKDKEKQKEREKHKEKEIDVVSAETPIKITIPKDKISGALKIKIPKDCLKKEEVDSLKSGTSGDLKIKISKDAISNISTYKEESKSDSRKRERSPKSSSDLPHSKSMKTSEKKSSSSSLKSNGLEGSSKNSSSHKHSVSENGSYFDISSLYDLPFDFEENGQGIIKTPDYDFEALNASEFPPDVNTSPENNEIEECDKSSHNESEQTKDDDFAATSEPSANAASPKKLECCDVDISCGGITADFILKPVSPLNDIDSPEHLNFIEGEQNLIDNPSENLSPLKESHSNVKKDQNSPETKCEDLKKDKLISVENCDVLKNYKTILDSHSRRCESEILQHSVSPVSPEETITETTNDNNNDDNNNKNNVNESVTNSEKDSVKSTKDASETENPNYYNKYFKKDGNSRIRSRDEKRTLKGRVDDRQRYYDRRYRTDYNERDRRDDRRYYRDYRDYNKDSSQYYYERKDERRFEYSDYSSNQYFDPSKVENTIANLNYDINANGTTTVYQGIAQTKTAPQFPQICDPTDMNVQYQYQYYNNYMYANGGYRFYGNMPYMNMSLIQQQPMPPGTGDSFVQLDPPPLPLEPPPDLPPPPETPPPPK